MVGFQEGADAAFAVEFAAGRASLGDAVGEKQQGFAGEQAHFGVGVFLVFQHADDGAGGLAHGAGIAVPVHKQGW